MSDGKEQLEALVLVGSPHEEGKSARLALEITRNLRERGMKVTHFEIAKYPVAACTGCGVCSQTGDCCIAGDSWGVLSKHMESCDVFVLVAPVYFAGPSGWLKAALDRCQVFWARKYVLQNRVPKKRPAHLVVIGDGGDPFGSGPLEIICTSALNCANLRIEQERIYRLIGEDYDLAYAEEIAHRVYADALVGE